MTILINLAGRNNRAPMWNVVFLTVEIIHQQVRLTAAFSMN